MILLFTSSLTVAGLYYVLYNQAAADIGLKPLLSGVKTEDEGLYTVQHRYWLQEMKKAVADQGAEK